MTETQQMTQSVSQQNLKEMVTENLTNQPDTTFLDLQDQEIEDLNVIVDLLSQFQYLEELNLSNNQFQHLPQDLSELRSVANLNLQNIVFEDFELSIQSISTMPVLRSLYVNLQTEDQVDLIMRILPQLEYLNGLPVDRDAIDDDQTPNAVPQNDAQLAVQQEAIANGNDQVQELPEAEEDSQGYDDTQQDIINNTSQANNTKHHDTSLLSAQSAARNADVLAQNLDTEELESLAMCFDNIRMMRSGNDNMVDNDDTGLGDQFDEVLTNMISTLTENLKATDSQIERGRAVISGKRDLMGLLVEKTLDYQRIVDPLAEIVLQELATQYETLIDQSLNLVEEATAAGGQNNNSKIGGKIMGGGDAAAQRKLKEKDREIKQLKEQVKLAQVGQNRDPEKDILRKKVKELEQENRQLRTRLSSNKKPASNVTPGGKAPMSAQRTRPRTSTASTSGPSGGGVAPIGRTQTRVLTQKQLKDTIQDMYAQKVRFDKKCQENKVGKETLEQYMYTYLNQKYGLKPLIVEWAAAIINGVKTYIKEEHDVALFAKILKNECDEDFRFIQMHVKDTLLNLVKVMLKDKYPLKSEKDIQKMLDTIQNGKIDDWMWQKILEKMYEERDAAILQDRIRDLIGLRSRQSQDQFSQSSKKMTREELASQQNNGTRQSSKLKYSDFRKIILDFQLQEHERFLIRFTNLFKSVDNDQDGVISEIQFKDLLRMMNVLETEDEIEQLLAQVDPFNNKKMTYSEVVLVLSSHMVPKDPYNPLPNHQIALLEKFIQLSENMDESQLRLEQPSQADADIGLSGLDTNQMMQDQSDYTQEHQPYAGEEDTLAV